MNNEIASYLSTLRLKVVEGIEKLKDIDIADDKFSVVVQNITTASTIVSQVEEKLKEKINDNEIIKEEKNVSN